MSPSLRFAAILALFAGSLQTGCAGFQAAPVIHKAHRREEFISLQHPKVERGIEIRFTKEISP